MARPSTDDETEGPPAAELNPERFEPEGEIQLDAYHFARAANAVLAACQVQGPVLQLEVFDDEGCLLVGTDHRSLLRAWVPMPDPSGWYMTQEVAGPPPKLDETPTRTIQAALGSLGLRMLTELGKAKRAKERRVELITIQWGKPIPDDDEPTLGGDLEPRAVRLITSENISIAADPQDAFAWRPYAKAIETQQASVVDFGVLISGSRAVQYGRISTALGGDHDMHISAAVLDDGSAYTRVQVPGFPVVRGFGMAS